jgi:uncharacterized protein YnzC (UPF0291/DUF896 family)
MEVIMNDKMIERINELSRKAKSGLTPEEKEEQSVLRRQYIDAVKGSLECNLKNVVIIDKDGSRQKLKKNTKM